MAPLRVLVVALASLLVLAGCSEIDELLGTNRCTTYNAERDGFQLSIRDAETVLSLGGTHDLTIDRSWLNNDLRRVSLTCLPDWTAEPAGVVEVDGTRVTALAPGTVKVTAVVTGRGGRKSDSVNFAVVPAITEVEPNNGMPAANELVPGVLTYGQNDYSGDEDWYFAELNPGQSLQFTLRRSIDADNGYFSYSAYGDAYDAAGSYLAGANRTVTNSGAALARYYLRVTSSGQIPYAVTVDYFD